MHRWRSLVVATAAAILGALLGAGAGRVAGTVSVPRPGEFPSYNPPRMADGRPDLNGIWQVLTTANYNLEGQVAQPGSYPHLMGVYGAEPPVQGIVEGGEIPYQPWALERRQKNFETRMMATPPQHLESPSGDPELKCYFPGVPRAIYLDRPFQIVQQSDFILLVHEYASTSRIIRMNWDEPSQVDNTFFMGWSRGRWDGDTLVVDVSALTDQTWFDRAGNFHSEAAHVIERFTVVSPYHLMYEATIEDPKVFTRPWRISFPLYRRMERNVQLLIFSASRSSSS